MDLPPVVKVVNMVILESAHHYLVHVVARHCGNAELDGIQVVTDLGRELLGGTRVVSASLQATGLPDGAKSCVLGAAERLG